MIEDLIDRSNAIIDYLAKTQPREQQHMIISLEEIIYQLHQEITAWRSATGYWTPQNYLYKE